MKTFQLRKSVIGAALAVLMVLALCIPAFAVPPTIQSDYYILMDAASGQILTSKNADSQLPPGGLVKILSALVAAETITDGSSRLTVTDSALKPLDYGVKNIGLTNGEIVSAADCLYAMLMVSANDAANVIAEAAGTTLDGFMTMIGNKALDLGAYNTVLKNPNGLNADGQVSTPKDIATITRAALASSSFMNYFGKVSYTLEPTNKRADAKAMNTSFLMLRDGDYHYDGILGGMIGFTSASKYVLMATAERDGRQLIVVVMKDESEAVLYQDAAKLLDYGFDEFITATVPSGVDLFTADLAQSGMKIGSVGFQLQNSVSLLLPAEYDTSKILAVPNGIPTVVVAGSSADYTANIIYQPDAEDESQNVVLMSEVPLKAVETLDPSAPSTTSGQDDPSSQSTPADTDNTGKTSDKTSGSTTVQTDASGNVIEPEEEGGFWKGVGNFFKKFFLVLLWIIIIAVCLLVVGVGVLYALRAWKRYKKKQARQQKNQK